MRRLIFGIGDLAETLWYHLTKENIEIDAFLLTEKSEERTFCGKPIIDLARAVSSYPPSKYSVYICVGYKQMNIGRKNIFDKISSLGYAIESYIHPTAQIMGEFGAGTLIFQNVSVDYGTNLGTANILCPNVVVSHHCTIGDFNYFSPASCVAGRVSIRDFCFVGANAVVKDYSVLSDYTLAGAGCYVSCDTQPQEVIVPARSVVLKNHKSKNFL